MESCRGCPDHLPGMNACHRQVKRGFDLLQATTPRSGRPTWCPRKPKEPTK